MKFTNLEWYTMQPITPPSQSQGQAAASNIDKAEKSQHPSTAYARVVSATHEHASTSAATRELPTEW